MAKNESKRLSPAVIVSDKNAVSALKAITDYAPANPAFKLSAIGAAEAELATAQEAEAQATAAQATARDNTVAKEWAYHNLVLGAKDQVTAQFGRDSTQVQSVGRKRESERKKPQRKPKTT